MNFGPADVKGFTAKGVYATELGPDGLAPFRWTNGDALITVPPQTFTPHDLVVRVNTFHAVPLTISAGGKELKQVPSILGPASFVVDVSGVDFKQPQVIELKSGTWVPEKVNGFTRTLGVELVVLELR